MKATRRHYVTTDELGETLKPLVESNERIHDALVGKLVDGKYVGGLGARLDAVEGAHKTAKRAFWTGAAAATAVLAKSAWDALKGNHS